MARTSHFYAEETAALDSTLFYELALEEQQRRACALVRRREKGGHVANQLFIYCCPLGVIPRLGVCYVL